MEVATEHVGSAVYLARRKVVNDAVCGSWRPPELGSVEIHLEWMTAVAR